MKKLSLFALIVTLAAAVPALAQGTTNFSGTALSGLDYSVYPGNPATDAQYVPAAGSTPALAQLSTTDSGDLGSADDRRSSFKARWGTSAPSARATIFTPTALAAPLEPRLTGFFG